MRLEDHALLAAIVSAAVTAIVAVAFAISLAGCKDERVVGWNPATMRCQPFVDDRFVQPFLDNEDCAHLPRPEMIPDELDEDGGAGL